MIVLTSFMDHVDRLVHPDARSSDVERVRHRVFIASRLGLFFAGLMLLPLGLACGHVPPLWEAIAAGCLTVPLGAAAYVSRTGRIVRGEAACLLAWMAFAAAATLGGGLSLGGGCMLLLLVPLQASLSGEASLVKGGLVAAAIGAVALVLVVLLGVSPAATAAAPTDAAILGPALLYCLGLAMGATELQVLRRHLQAQGEQRYRVLSEASGDLVLRYDRVGGVVMASREAEPLFGIMPRELLGRGFFERVHVADRPAFLKLFSDAADRGENVSASLRLRTSREAAQGRVEEPVFAWIELRARRFADGDVVRRTDESPIVAIVRDVTAQKQHEIEIRHAKEEAERANAWKDAFLANVSHELRTPLNAIIGFSEMLANPDLKPRDPAKQRDYAEIITSSGQHLLSVVNSLLDISKIEAGRFDINPEAFGVAAMIEACCDMVGLKAEQAGITVRRDLSSMLGEVIADKRACKQIVINLLSNALKFTPGGGEVVIAAKPLGTSVCICVVDTGIGIAPGDLARLGDAFFQGACGFDRPYEGTGLGLSVVRGLVGLHGGTIAIESAPGEGTRVTVRLPLDCRAAAAAPSGAAKIETIPRYDRPVTTLGPAETAKVQRIA